MTRGVASKILIVDDASFMRSVLKDIIKNNWIKTLENLDIRGVILLLCRHVNYLQ